MLPPALALLEYDSVAAGIRAADAMVKRAPIAFFKAGTVHPGHYLVLIGGTVASVEEAWKIGVGEAPGFLVDEVFLPNAHADVRRGVLGERRSLQEEALGVLETRCAASLLRAADAGVKGAAVRIAELRLADDLGGRAFVLFDGPLTEVQAALDIGEERVAPDRMLHQSIVPRLDASVRRALTGATRFSACEVCEPDGAELPWAQGDASGAGAADPSEAGAAG